VVYVDVPGSGDETRDKTEACRLAKEVAKQWLLKKNAQSLAAKKKRLAKGECRSCREPLFSAQYCEYHTKKHNASAAQRYRDRRDGITKKPRKYATPLESFQAEKKTRKLIHRTSGSKDGRYLAWFKHELSHAQQAVSHTLAQVSDYLPGAQDTGTQESVDSPGR
jgi:hypothetical protein